jgi:hypothetical protein
MKIFTLLAILGMISMDGRAIKKYKAVQSKIVTVQTKIDNVNQKINEVSVLVDSLGFQLIEKPSK